MPFLLAAVILPCHTPAAVAGSTDRISPDSLAALAGSLAPVVEDLRGLKFRRAVPVEVVDDSTARHYFVGRLEAAWPDSSLRAEERALQDLGLLPRASDLRAILLDVLEEQAGGYYDPARGTFFVLGDAPASILPVLMVHELTHALDDQHFGIDSTLAACGDSEREGAYSAVVEGSGTLVMTAFLLGEVAQGRIGAEALAEFQATDFGSAERLSGAPPVVRRSLLAPYVLGSSFLQRGRSGPLAGLRAVDLDRAFREPPDSFEQVLHPEKYWDPAEHDPPRPAPDVDPGRLLGPGWERRGSGTLGELLLALLVGAVDPPLDDLAALEPDRWTVPAAAGWDADRWWTYARGEESATVLWTVWDTRDDARQFEAALVLPAAARVARDGTRVVVVVVPDPELARHVARRTLGLLAPR